MIARAVGRIGHVGQRNLGTILGVYGTHQFLPVEAIALARNYVLGVHIFIANPDIPHLFRSHEGNFTANSSVKSQITPCNTFREVQ